MLLSFYAISSVIPMQRWMLEKKSCKSSAGLFHNVTINFLRIPILKIGQMIDCDFAKWEAGLLALYFHENRLKSIHLHFNVFTFKIIPFFFFFFLNLFHYKHNPPSIFTLSCFKTRKITSEGK